MKGQSQPNIIVECDYGRDGAIDDDADDKARKPPISLPLLP
jgi:hypothetical protein